MSEKQRMREVLEGPLTADHLARRAKDGWRAVAVEWQREAGVEAATGRTEVPYGLKVSDDCHLLETDPEEMAALRLILSLMVRDRPLSEAVGELERRGFRRRDGGTFNQADVFGLLPRMVDVAPEIYASPAWKKERQRLQRVV